MPACWIVVPVGVEVGIVMVTRMSQVFRAGLIVGASRAKGTIYHCGFASIEISFTIADIESFSFTINWMNGSLVAL